GSLPGWRSDAVLDEKAGKPQRQKIVRWADLIAIATPWPSSPPPGLAFGEPDDRLLRGIQYAAAYRLHRGRTFAISRRVSPEVCQKIPYPPKRGRGEAGR